MATKNAINSNKPIEVAVGGTGVSSITDHVVVVGSGTGAVTELAAAYDGQLIIGSTGADPVIANLISTDASISITDGAGSIDIETGGAVGVQFDGDAGSAVPAAGVLDILGGTNLTSSAAGAAVTINLDAALAGTTSHDFANAGRIGTATGAGNTLLLQAYDVDGVAYTTFATLTANNTPTCDLDTAVTCAGNYIYRATGTDIPVTDGGTGLSAITDHAVAVGSGAAAMTVLAAATDGQLIIGSTGADPAVTTLTEGANITITEGAGTITIASSDAAGMTWTEAAGATQAMAVDTGYTTNNGAQLDYTLPAAASVGERVAVVGNSANGWTLSQNAGQTVHFVSSDTTTGVGGSLTSTNRYDCVELVCVTEDTDFVVRSVTGNITVV